MQLRSLARNLVSAFEIVPDARARTGPSVSPAGILALSALAALDGAFRPRDISRWARGLSDAVLEDMGFFGRRFPLRDTLQSTFERVDRPTVSYALATWTCAIEYCPDWNQVRTLRIRPMTVPASVGLFDIEQAADEESRSVATDASETYSRPSAVRTLRRWKRTAG